MQGAGGAGSQGSRFAGGPAHCCGIRRMSISSALPQNEFPHKQAGLFITKMPDMGKYAGILSISIILVQICRHICAEFLPVRNQVNFRPAHYSRKKSPSFKRTGINPVIPPNVHKQLTLFTSSSTAFYKNEDYTLAR